MSIDNKKYILHRNFLTFKECDEWKNIIYTQFKQISKKSGHILSRLSESNHSKNINKNRIFTTESNKIFEEIESEYRNIIDFKKYEISFMNAQEYSNGRGLGGHVDTASQLTSTLLLSDDFTGGNFFVENETIPLKRGDLLVFNGGKISHGVKPVLSGFRLTLNIWYKIKNNSVI